MMFTQDVKLDATNLPQTLHVKHRQRVEMLAKQAPGFTTVQ